MPATKKMGFEGLIYYGAAGSTASQLIENSRDIKEVFGTEKGDTTTRGAGVNPPIETGRVCKRTYGIEWQMTNKSDDTIFLALMAAAVAGTPVAIRSKAHSSGHGFDGDMILDFSHGKPLNGEQTIDFSASPNDDSRAPQLNV